MNFTILRFETVGSTNTEAVSQAKQGADEGLCIVARQQSAGRGRHGRTWISEKDAGLYFSLVLRPQVENKFLSLITLTAAVAVRDLLVELYDLQPDIKWANDVHINGKKIAGILAEMVETAKGTMIVVGIGINLKSANFPPELAEIATSIEQETRRTADVETLLPNLTRLLADFYHIFQSADGAEKIRGEWSKRSSYARGKSIKVLLENETIVGVTCGIEENGALRVRLENGAIKIIQAGDVEMVRKS